jgi:hypothetical protein
MDESVQVQSMIDVIQIRRLVYRTRGTLQTFEERSLDLFSNVLLPVKLRQLRNEGVLIDVHGELSP